MLGISYEDIRWKMKKYDINRRGVGQRKGGHWNKKKVILPLDNNTNYSVKIK